MAKVHELRFEIFPHPTYSPDFVPSALFLFLNLKIWLGGKRFLSDKIVAAVVDEHYKGFETS